MDDPERLSVFMKIMDGFRDAGLANPEDRMWSDQVFGRRLEFDGVPVTDTEESDDDTDVESGE